VISCPIAVKTATSYQVIDNRASFRTNKVN